jgi:hypothetical protein
MSLLIWLSIPAFLAIGGMAVVITNQTLYPRMRAQNSRGPATGAVESEQPAAREPDSARAA